MVFVHFMGIIIGEPLWVQYLKLDEFFYAKWKQIWKYEEMQFGNIWFALCDVNFQNRKFMLIKVRLNIYLYAQ